MLPRWTGYLNLWCAALFLPGSCVVFFKTGPLAWNGILAWWVVLAAFSIWLIAMSIAMLCHSIPQQQREHHTQSMDSDARPALAAVSV